MHAPRYPYLSDDSLAHDVMYTNTATGLAYIYVIMPMPLPRRILLEVSPSGATMAKRQLQTTNVG